MAFNSTSWTTDGLTKAGATSSTSQSLTTGTLTANTLTLSENAIRDSAGDTRIVLDPSANTVEVRNASFLIQNVDNESPYPKLTSDPDNNVHTLTLAGSGFGDDTLVIGRTEGHAIQLYGTTTWGVDGTGWDVKFYGDTATNGYMLWDQSEDELLFGSAVKIGIGQASPSYPLDIQTSGTDVIARFKSTDNDAVLYLTSGDAGDDSMISFNNANDDGRGLIYYDHNATAANQKFVFAVGDSGSSVSPLFIYGDGQIHVGVDDAGHDVKFFGATSGKYMLWDESEDKLEVSGNIQITGTQLAIVASSSTELLFSGGNIGNITSEGSIIMKAAASKTISIGSNDQDDSITIDTSENVSITGGSLTVSGNFACNGQSAAARPDYTITNLDTDRALDCASTSTAELADVLGQVITDLIAVGIFQ